MAPPTAMASAPSCHKLAKPFPLLAPAVFSSVAALLCKDLILERRSSIYLKYKPSVVALNSSLRASLMLSRNIGARGFLSCTGTRYKHLAALSPQILGVDEGDFWHKNQVFPRWQRNLFSTRAYEDDIFKFVYPTITEKPDWWWRTLACVPYLIALQISDARYFLQPFLEH